MKSVLALFLFLSLVSAIFANENAVRYTMADLEALEGQKNYNEFFEHALDILPSLRGEIWQQMVAGMATGLIDFKSQRQDYKPKSWQQIEKLSLWPVLQSDEFFQTKRRRYFLEYIERCLNSNGQNNEDCTKQIQRYWANSFKNTDAGLQLAKLIEEHSLKLDSWDFIHKAPHSELSHFHCKKPLVQRQLIGQLGLKMKKGPVSFSKWPDHIQELMNETCWKKLTPDLKRSLMERSTAQLTKDLIYQLLKSQENIDQEQEDLFLVKYLLEGPIVGDTFNLAWKRLAKIAEDYKRRKTLFENIQKLDPLPGNIFASPNTKKRDIVMRHIHQYFPEYFPYYAQTCLNYMSGQGEFPRGNPTIQCEDFFNVTDTKGWIQDEVQSRYSGLKK